MVCPMAFNALPRYQTDGYLSASLRVGLGSESDFPMDAFSASMVDESVARYPDILCETTFVLKEGSTFSW